MTVILNSVSGKSLISILLKLFLEIYLIMLFVTSPLFFSFTFTLCVSFCTLAKTITSSLDRRSRVEKECCCQSAWPELLLVSKTFVIFQATVFILGGSSS